MNNPELYKRTVDILVNAYFNDTLKHGHCHACAVGNIVAANCGIVNIASNSEWIEKAIAPASLGWAEVFLTERLLSKQLRMPKMYRRIKAAKYQIDSTGYTWQELAKIEYAFETAPNGGSNDEWMFNGLMAVIDVLDEIHDNKDSEVTTQTKKRFNKNKVKC